MKILQHIEEEVDIQNMVFSKIRFFQPSQLTSPLNKGMYLPE